MHAWTFYFKNEDDLRWALHIAETQVRPEVLTLDAQHKREGRFPHPVSAGVFLSILRHMAQEGMDAERVKELVGEVWSIVDAND